MREPVLPMARAAGARYPSPVNAKEIQAGLRQSAEAEDPVIRHLLLAALCTRVFGARGIDLIAVGGSAIEFYTEGAYTSGDVDLCVLAAKQRLTLRERQETMGLLAARGGPRSWEVAGSFIDILGDFEGSSRSKPRRLETELGPVALAPAEELLVERTLIAKYPGPYLPAWECARKLAAACLRREVEIDWKETLRLARLPAYQNERDLKELIETEAKTLALRSPYDSDE